MVNGLQNLSFFLSKKSVLNGKSEFCRANPECRAWQWRTQVKSQMPKKAHLGALGPGRTSDFEVL